MITKYDEHLTLNLPYGYKGETKKKEDGSNVFSIECGEKTLSNGENTPEMSILVTRLNGAIDQNSVNFKGDFPACTGGSIGEMDFNLQVNSSFGSSPGGALKYQLMTFFVGISNTANTYEFLALKTGKETAFSENCDQIAKHVNRVLECITLDGKPGNFQKLTGRNVQCALKEGKKKSVDSANRLMNTYASTEWSNNNRSTDKFKPPIASSAEEEERRRKEAAEYRAWEKKRREIYSEAQKEIDAQNDLLKKDADQINHEYNQKYGAQLTQKADLENQLQQTQKQLSFLREVSGVGMNTKALGIAITCLLIGFIIFVVANGSQKLFGLLFGLPGILILGVNLAKKTSRKNKESSLEKTELSLESKIAQLGAVPSVEQFANSNKSHLNPSALQNGGHISDEKENEIRSRLEQEYSLPPEPPRPEAFSGDYYSTGSLSPQQEKKMMQYEAILDNLDAKGEMTITDMLENIPELNGEDNKHVSSLCRQLVLTGRLAKFTKGGKTYFTLNW